MPAVPLTISSSSTVGCRPKPLALVLLMAAWVLPGAHAGAAQISAVGDSAIVGEMLFDDFESYQEGGIPDRWQWLTSKSIGPLTADRMTDRRSFLVREEGGNRFVRATVTNLWHRIVLTNDEPVKWSLKEMPCLSWDWRALRLPEGAREDKVNDTGAAVYVYFGRDWLGRPRSIKYSYSSTLPVGTEQSFGPLKLVVVSSGIDPIQDWVTVERNVADDYDRLFNRKVPTHPSLIALWSDTDTTKDTAIADFDNIRASTCR